MRFVGTKYMTYQEKRNLLLPFKNHRIVRIVDAGVLLNALMVRIDGQNREKWWNIQRGPAWPRVDGFHLWNGISIGRRAWVTTLELPYVDESWCPDMGGFYARDTCRAMFCLSNWCARAARMKLGHHRSAAAIFAKLRVQHPPQALNQPRQRQAMEDGELRLLFVGRAFVRKGGLICLHAFERLKTRFPFLRLYLVSSLSKHDWPIDAEERDVQEAREIIQRNTDRIIHHPEMPNAQVLELCRQCDVGLLPTLLDSFGYSALEMMSCGLPLLTSDILALPEINNSERGWMVEFPNDPVECRPLRSTRAQHEQASAIALERTTAAIAAIAADPQAIDRKSLLCRQYVAEHHSLEAAAANLERVYETF